LLRETRAKFSNILFHKLQNEVYSIAQSKPKDSDFHNNPFSHVYVHY